MMPLPLAAARPPSLVWIAPFALLLLAIALLPLIPHTHRWWERNRNKLLIAAVFAGITLVHFASRGFGTTLHEPVLTNVMQTLGFAVALHDGHAVTAPGAGSAVGALGNALFDYVPFIVLLLTLYCITGGITIRGDIPAHPATNTLFLAIGGVLASLIGTTGASMLLIRPLLKTNSERKHVAHTVIFFIFIVSNIGGCLLPIGDPPLFLGYLRGVPFFWTLVLWKEWALMLGLLLAVYYVWDCRAYRHESPGDLARDETQIQRVRIIGRINFVWLLLTVAAVAVLSPGAAVPGTDWRPPIFLRECVELLLVVVSVLTTPSDLRRAAGFSLHPIAEVAALFLGIFIAMQVPMELLQARGRELGLTQPWQFFWAAGTLSSFLDNAPTYVVFFQTANAMTNAPGPGVFPLLDGNLIRHDLLAAISLGAVFMGANTYIGNGPNFMVKSIAERHGVRMPGFFGYMLYSGLILVPLFVLMTMMLIR